MVGTNPHEASLQVVAGGVTVDQGGGREDWPSATAKMTFLIPGTGGTAELFSDYRFPCPFRALEFPTPGCLKMSMKDYAEQFVEHHGIVPGDTLVGMSLGGMLACEI